MSVLGSPAVYSRLVGFVLEYPKRSSPVLMLSKRFCVVTIGPVEK